MEQMCITNHFCKVNKQFILREIRIVLDEDFLKKSLNNSLPKGNPFQKLLVRNGAFHNGSR